jgi:predicted RND superfamily exporter protein
MRHVSVSELVERLVKVQVRRPWVPLGIVATITMAFGLFASRLELRTRYEALLPDSQPSVQELRRVEARTSLAQTVLVLLEGPDRTALRRLGDALVPALAALGPDVVSNVEDGPRETRKFLEPRAGLFVDRVALEKLAKDVDARWDYEIAKETDTLLDDDDPPPPLTAEELKRRLQPDGPQGATNRFPAGYYERSDGTALVVVARSPIAGGDLARIGAAMGRMRAAIEAVKHSRPEFASLRVSYAGDMPTGLKEYSVVRDDLLGVGLTGIALVLGAVFLYFMRIRALIVMAVSILAGLTWTFGLTQIVIGHLNIATAFLISIVAGNGINVGILYQSRYFEQRQAGASAAEAVRTAVRTTWLPTVIAALASAASYGSLLVTDFRAFRDFGFIAGSGMVLCWVVQTLAVFPLLILLDRRPVERAPLAGRFGMAYGKIFARLVPKGPRALFVAGIGVALAGSVLAVRYTRSDPMEYDMRKVQNDRGAASDLQRAWAVCNDILGTSQGGMVILTDTAREARQLHDALSARWNAAPADAKPFAAVRSLWSFVPNEQEQKLPTLLALGSRLERAHARGFVSEADWQELRPLLPPGDLTAFGIADLPEETAGPFTDKSGTRGTLVFVEGEPTTSEDLRYLLRYADSFRETRLPSGKVVRGSGHAVIFADMLKAVVRDIPKAISLSLFLTVVTVIVTFRRASRALSVLFALAVGSAGVAAFLYLGKVKLNFLNFAALPITFGIGVDYAVNVAQRYYADGRNNVVSALRTSGGAVVLCSLTTLLGYLALLGSHNQAIRSLGTIGVVGELSCLLAAVVVMPAMWLALRSFSFGQYAALPTTHGASRERHAR